MGAVGSSIQPQTRSLPGPCGQRRRKGSGGLLSPCPSSDLPGRQRKHRSHLGEAPNTLPCALHNGGLNKFKSSRAASCCRATEQGWREGANGGRSCHSCSWHRIQTPASYCCISPSCLSSIHQGCRALSCCCRQT